jgi:BCD family chlorophyll transporter-like MFS transporter
MAKIGAWGAIVAFILIAASGWSASQSLFYSAVVLLGLATGLATVSNLSLMFDMTVAGNVGLFIGAWGMANAFARLVGSLVSGVARDVFTSLAGNPLNGYLVVFLLEAGMLVVSLILLRSIDVGAFRRQAGELSLVERAALASEA